MAHTTRYGNTYSDLEWAEMQESFAEEARRTSRFFELKDESIEKAASFLNKEFPDVPVATWKEALNNEWEFEPREIKFTSPEKAARYECASKWVESEMKKEGYL